MTDKNSPAYPANGHYGINIRQYYAAKAMQGIVSNPDCSFNFKIIAENSFKIADALIEFENKEE